MKKLLVFILSLLLLFLPANIYAESTDEDKNNTLTPTELQYLKEILEIDPSFDWEGELIHIEKLDGNFDGLHTAEVIDNNLREANQLNLSNSDMTIYITYSIRSNAVTDRVDVNVLAYWNVPTSGNYEDRLAVAWAGGFAVTYSSCSAVYYNGSQRGTLRDVTPNVGLVYSFPVTKNNSSLKYVRIATKLYRSTHVAEVINYVGKYVHFYSVASVSFTFGNEPSITVNCSTAYDTLAKYVAISFE